MWWIRCQNSDIEVAGSNPDKCNLKKGNKSFSCKVSQGVDGGEQVVKCMGGGV